MSASRRHLLAASAGLVSSLAGCLSSFSGGDPRDRTPESPGREPGDPTTTDSPTTDSPATREYPTTVRATTTIDREGIEYVSANDTVRYVARWRTNTSGETITRKPIYETIEFEEWAEIECASVAAARVTDVIRERVEGDAESISSAVTTEEGTPIVVVQYRTLLNRDGEVISEPTVPYERVKRVAPRKVAVSLTFEGRKHHCVVQVKTRRIEVRQE